MASCIELLYNVGNFLVLAIFLVARPRGPFRGYQGQALFFFGVYLTWDPSLTEFIRPPNISIASLLLACSSFLIFCIVDFFIINLVLKVS